MLLVLASLFFSFFLAFLVTARVLPFMIARMKQRHITGIDANKIGRPKIAEMGGICVWLGFTTGIIASIFVFSYLKWIEINLTFLLAGFSTIAMVGFLGVIDDLIGWKKGLRQWQHALIPVFAALPLMAIKVSNPPIFIPFFGFAPAQFVIPFVGVVSFGVIYSLIFVPIGVTGASNAANMLAGLNGLEAGLGAIISATMLAIALAQGQVEAAIVSIAMLGALIAFLRFNWYPARVFGGDSLTLMIGASIATAAILGNMEKIGVLLLAIYFAELLLKARFRMQREGFGIPAKDGTLLAPKQVASVTHVVMRLGRFSEKRVVEIILAMQLVVSVAVFSMSYFKLF
jgi:UDP-N-acetylglucosamine--dolichyl-phosphate N-acetylglucosaminephosphotransferase